MDVEFEITKPKPKSDIRKTYDELEKLIETCEYLFGKEDWLEEGKTELITRMRDIKNDIKRTMNLKKIKVGE